jgi:hypothetical protein
MSATVSAPATVSASIKSSNEIVAIPALLAAGHDPTSPDRWSGS